MIISLRPCALKLQRFVVTLPREMTYLLTSIGEEQELGSFPAAPKGPQPVKSVDHNTGHSL